ncbi:Nucleolar complex protein 3, partial [Quaeritorhiza haematococci]
ARGLAVSKVLEQRQKQKLPPTEALAISGHESEEDVELSEEDLKFLDDYVDYTNFLTDLRPDDLARNKSQNARLNRKAQLQSHDSDDSDSEAAAFREPDEHVIVVPRNKRKRIDEDEEEAEYEKRPRQANEEWSKSDSANAVPRLPIIDGKGRLQKLETPLVVENVKEVVALEETLAKPEKKKDQKKDNKQAKKPLPAKKTQKSPLEEQDPTVVDHSRTFVQVQEQLADLATALTADPEANIGSLKVLRDIVSSPDNRVKKVALLTLLAVFKDIIPGYRIRQLTDKEKTVKVSKEVKKLRQYEQTLLSNYQAYLSTLESTIETQLGKLKKSNTTAPSKHSNGSNRNTDGSGDTSLLIVAIKCMTDLLTSVTHFNFRINLMTAVVNRMTVRTPSEVSILCCNAIRTLFENDESGEASLEAVKLISKMVKTKNYNVGEEILQTFLHLRLKDELVIQKDDQSGVGQKKRKKDQEHKSRKTRKLEKYTSEVEKELKEAEAVYDREEKHKLQTETLKFVFVTYFRILKHKESSPLLPAVLEGLSRFAHLVNVDFFEDLLGVLKKIALSQYQRYLGVKDAGGKGDNEESSDGLDNRPAAQRARSALHCVVAAFQLLTGQAEVLNIDLRDFCNSLYAQMMVLPMMGNTSAKLSSPSGNVDPSLAHMESEHSKTCLELVLHGFELLLCKKKQVPVERAAAFAKRLAAVSLHLPSNAALACLCMLRSLFLKYPRLEPLLETDGRLGTGVYRPLLDDPDLCNAFATNIWELTPLMTHYHPTVRKSASYLASLSVSGMASSGSSLKPPPRDLNMTYPEFLTEYEWMPSSSSSSSSSSSTTASSSASSTSHRQTFVFVPPVGAKVPEPSGAEGKPGKKGKKSGFIRLSGLGRENSESAPVGRPVGQLQELDMQSLNGQAVSWMKNKLGLVDGEFKMSAESQTSHNGVYHYYCNMRWNNISIINANANVNVDRFGRVISMGMSSMDMSRLQAEAVDPNSTITAIDAFLSFANTIQLQVNRTRLTETPIDGAEDGKVNIAARGGIPSVRGSVTAAKRYYRSDPETLHLVWDLRVPMQTRNYNAQVSATNGTVLAVSDLIARQRAPKLSPFEAGIDEKRFQPAGKNNTLPNTVYRAIPIGTPLTNLLTGDVRQLITNPADLEASPMGWHKLSNKNGEAIQYDGTAGNNVIVSQNLQIRELPLPGVDRPEGTGFRFDFPVDDKNQQPPAYVNASLANAFYVANSVHDIFYKYGLTEAAGNFQNDK